MRVVKLLLSKLNSIHQRALKSLGEEKAAIFEGHLMILEDEELEEEILDYLRSHKVNASVAASKSSINKLKCCLKLMMNT